MQYRRLAAARRLDLLVAAHRHPALEEEGDSGVVGMLRKTNNNKKNNSLYFSV